MGWRPRPSGTRHSAHSAKIEAGHVYLPRDADWLDSYLLELLAFPHGKHDDQVDSVSQFLTWAALRELGYGQTYAMPIIVQNEQPTWDRWADNRF